MEEIIDKDAVEDVRSCIISIPKPRVFTKRSKDLIIICSNRNPIKGRQDFRIRKPSETTLKKYSLPQAKPLRVKRCGKDEILLSFRQFAKKESRIKHRQRMAIKTREEYKIRSTDLRKRLYIESPSNDVYALTDIDKDFFNFINGRPLSYHGGSCFKFVLPFFNYRLMKKIEVGYRIDTILNIDANYEREKVKYHLCVESCTNQAKCFEQFISEDYQKSMACLEKWEEVKYDVFLKNGELESLASEIFTITSRLVGLDYVYTLQQKYGRFLYYLSPPTWRSLNREFAQSIEIETKGFDLGVESREDDSFIDIFDKMQRECSGNFIKPALYFKAPDDLVGVFEAIETQQQYQFAHVTRMAPLIKLLHIGILNLKEIIAMDSAAVANSIKGFEAQIEFYTERSLQLEYKFFKILHGLFYESVGTLDVLKFKVHLEFCFEKVMLEKPINLDIRAMAKGLENVYLDYQMRLEKMQGDDVKKAIKECIKEEKLLYKKAKEAARELRLFERLEHELQIAFAPVKRQGGRIVLPPTVSRQCPARNEVINQNKCKPKPKIDEKSLTDVELEYLQLFTEWDPNEDPALYIHSHD